MKIFKSINNNIVSAYDDEGKEVVVIGKGIGYKAQRGAEIPGEKVEKVFSMRSQNEMDRLKELIVALPSEYISLTDEILTYAKNRLKKRLHEGAFVTLADHINFTIMRTKQEMTFQNVLHLEIRRFYSQEYEIGKYALELIKDRLGISLPDDEAASIALHIFNAEYDISVSDAFRATRMLNSILEIVTKETGHTIDENSYYGELFITHLKFLAQMIIKKMALPSGDDDFSEFAALHYPEEMQCAESIADHVQQNYDYCISKEGMANLAMYIRRIRNE